MGRTTVIFLIILQNYLACEESSTTIVSPLCEKLNFAIQPPLFEPGHRILLSSKEIVQAIKPILKTRISETNYDRIFPILQFLDHYEECKKIEPNISPLQAFKTFRFNPFAPNQRGGPCISLTLDILEALPCSIKGYIIAAKLPGKFQQFGFPWLCHTAVLIPYQNPIDETDKGFVLLDPSFDISEPVLLTENQPSFIYNAGRKGIWKFYLKDDQIICDILNEISKSVTDFSLQWRMVYSTQRLLNPIESSAMPMILTDRRLSLLSRKEDGSTLVHLNIELNKGKIIWDQEGVQYQPVSFEKINRHLWAFPDWFSSKLFMDNSTLSKKITRVLENKEVLDNLYREYIELIRSTQDFTITGELDFKLLMIDR